MTITRELQSATVKTYGTSVDAYGQLEQGTPAERSIALTVKLYSQMNVQDPRYIDVELVGLTKDNAAPGEVISLAQGDYRVKYVIPSNRWQQLMLVRL